MAQNLPSKLPKRMGLHQRRSPSSCPRERTIPKKYLWECTSFALPQPSSVIFQSLSSASPPSFWSSCLQAQVLPRPLGLVRRRCFRRKMTFRPRRQGTLAVVPRGEPSEAKLVVGCPHHKHIDNPLRVLCQASKQTRSKSASVKVLLLRGPGSARRQN
jgi:hypothetical protein